MTAFFVPFSLKAPPTLVRSSITIFCFVVRHSLLADVINKLKDYERIPLSQDIQEYYDREVKPHLPNSWMNRDKDSIGYEINFTKYFYKYKPRRDMEDITNDLLKLEKETEGLMSQIL